MYVRAPAGFPLLESVQHSPAVCGVLLTKKDNFRRLGCTPPVCVCVHNVILPNRASVT